MLKIEHSEDQYLTADIYDDTVEVVVSDFAGTFDNPWQKAEIDLTLDEVRKLHEYLGKILTMRG